ncbi:MAG: SBBP repeat-containing protein, partial [Candidatus Angelobacter sp.]
MVRKIVLIATIFCLHISFQAQQAVTKPAARLKGLPVSFEVNQGQVDSQVHFLAHAGQGTMYFTSAEAVLALASRDSQNKSQISALRLKWVGANPNPQIVAEQPLPGRINYLIGRDPARWHTGIHTFARVRYRGLYPGVDAVYYGTEGKIEYDLVLSPGASLGKVSLAFNGPKSKTLAENGDLVLGLGNGEVRQLRPVAYQHMNGTRRLLAAHYVIHRDKTVGFEVAGYDRKLPLVIDPTLAYSTFVSPGSNFHFVTSVAVDQSGNAYVTGSTTVAFPNLHPEFGSQGSGNAY